MTFEEKVELFFFDPYASRDDFIKRYQELNAARVNKEHGGYRYSPLFALMKDIHYCLGVGKEFNPIRKQFKPADFAAIILIRACFTNTVKLVYPGSLQLFAAEYMGLHDSELLTALNELRNALEHKFYGLRTIQKTTGIEFAFTAGTEYNAAIQHLPGRTDQKQMFAVNPRMLYSGFYDGLRQLKKDLLDPSKKSLRTKFDRNFNIDDWVLII